MWPKALGRPAREGLSTRHVMRCLASDPVVCRRQAFVTHATFLISSPVSAFRIFCTEFVTIKEPVLPTIVHESSAIDATYLLPPTHVLEIAPQGRRQKRIFFWNRSAFRKQVPKKPAECRISIEAGWRKELGRIGDQFGRISRRTLPESVPPASRSLGSGIGEPQVRPRLQCARRTCRSAWAVPNGRRQGRAAPDGNHRCRDPVPLHQDRCVPEADPRCTRPDLQKPLGDDWAGTQEAGLACPRVRCKTGLTIGLPAWALRRSALNDSSVPLASPPQAGDFDEPILRESCAIDCSSKTRPLPPAVETPERRASRTARRGS